MAFRSRRRWILALSTLAVTIVAAELTLRLAFGLGTPVRAVLDPEIEYLLAPNQDVRRFGCRTITNDVGMRSRPISATRTDPNERRILVIGDSVVNGGAVTDHEALATTIAERSLQEAWGRPVFVGNISAGSWGPPNQEAYLRRFGWFDADLVILVLSSTDAADDRSPPPRTRAPLPTEAPWSALGELVSRYLLPRLSRNDEPAPASADRLDEPEAVLSCRTALSAMLETAASRGIPVVVLQHWELPELEAGSARPGHDLIAVTVDEHHVPRHDLREWLPKSSEPRIFFRDHIHLSNEGQAVLAHALTEIALKAFSTSSEAPSQHKVPKS
ncbi:MAG: SGNH/GDSL hydrolase family protein [Phycisphaerae bacterium]|nr:SGNH/GDSL hydrolase family protein [Phycisphaerae bacterium]